MKQDMIQMSAQTGQCLRHSNMDIGTFVDGLLELQRL